MVLRYVAGAAAQVAVIGGLLLAGVQTVHAADLALPNGGRVSIELLTSDAVFHNTLSILNPGVQIVSTGCRLEPADGLGGLRLMSEKNSQHGCRVDLDADAATPGVQAFAPGTVLEFAVCAQEDTDAACENIWSSDPNENSDSFDHVVTTPLNAADFPGRIFQIAWEDLAGGGDQDFNDIIAVVRADVDSDGDGLWDDWERFGADTDGDGVVDLDLPGLGADPNHRDVFVEVDWMDCSVAGSDCAMGDTHSHQPKAAAVAAAVAAFAAAPVRNPDGTDGIDLHILQSNAIAHQNFLNIPNLCQAAGAGIGSFDTVKNDPANFGPNNPRRFAVHYSLWTHQEAPGVTESGCGELPGNDFQVALGGWNLGLGDADGDGSNDADVGTVAQQAGTLIHELGHNLNLQHGGGDGVNRKPNFLSAMSYWFQMPGIPPTDPDAAGPLMGRVDYSRVALGNLVETSLNEPAGMGLGTDNSFYRCPSGSSSSAVGNDAIDWNCNGSNNEASVSSDVNGDGSTGTLVGFADWTNISYSLQSTGSFDDGYHDESVRAPEITYALYRDIVLPDLAVSGSVIPPSVVTGRRVTYPIVVRNLQPHAAADVQLTQELPASVQFARCAADHDGVCGGSGGQRSVDFAVLPGGEAATISMQGIVACSTPDGTVGTSTLAVSTATDETTLDNNTAEFQFVAVNPAPVISHVDPSRRRLSHAHGQLVRVKIDYDVRDNCGKPQCSLSVSSSDPVRGHGDHTAPDWKVIDAHRVELRAEHSRHDGRTYDIAITCVDSGGGATTKTVQVEVPKDRHH